jgi:hypothetical protein
VKHAHILNEREATRLHAAAQRVIDLVKPLLAVNGAVTAPPKKRRRRRTKAQMAAALAPKVPRKKRTAAVPAEPDAE